MSRASNKHHNPRGAQASTLSTPSNKQIPEAHLVKIREILTYPDVKGDTIEDLIIKLVLASLDATNVTREQKFKYIKMVEQFCPGCSQNIDKYVQSHPAFGEILFHLVISREHLQKDTESVLVYLLNSKIFGPHLFAPNRTDAQSRTLLEYAEALQTILTRPHEIKANQKFIKWLKQNKGAMRPEKMSSGAEAETKEKNKVELQAILKASGQKIMQEAPLDCIEATLNHRTAEIISAMKAMFNNPASKSRWGTVLEVVRESYQDLDAASYIKILEEINNYIPVPFMQAAHFLQIITFYWNHKEFRSKKDNWLLEKIDYYTSILIKLLIQNRDDPNISPTSKYLAYKYRVDYCKRKQLLKEAAEAAFEALKYASSSSEVEETLFSLLVLLHSAQNSSFKTGMLTMLCDKYHLLGYAKDAFIKLFSQGFIHGVSNAYLKDYAGVIKESIGSADEGAQRAISRVVTSVAEQATEGGDYTVSELRSLVENADPHDYINILGILRYYTKEEIEQTNYQKILDLTVQDRILMQNGVVYIKIAELYISLENFNQTMAYLQKASKLIVQTHASGYHFNPTEYLKEIIFSFLLAIFTKQRHDFLQENFDYITKLYAKCQNSRPAFLATYKSEIDVIDYYLAAYNKESDEKQKKLIEEIAANDGVVFSLALMSQKQQEQEQQQKISVANDSAEHKEVEATGAASSGASASGITISTEETVEAAAASYKTQFVAKCLSQGQLVHKYYQDLKKQTLYKQQNLNHEIRKIHYSWQVSDKLAYSTKDAEHPVYLIDEKHNIYAVIHHDLLAGLKKSQQLEECANALQKGFAKGVVGHSGVKVLEKFFPELKTSTGLRLYAKKIFISQIEGSHNNANKATLIEFSESGNHTDIEHALKYGTLHVVEVPRSTMWEQAPAPIKAAVCQSSSAASSSSSSSAKDFDNKKWSKDVIEEKYKLPTDHATLIGDDYITHTVH